MSRAAVNILPQLGDKFVSELTPAILRRWLADLARSPAQLRSPRAGKLSAGDLRYRFHRSPRLRHRRELRRNNLTCRCALDELCHADILLEIANA
jgi:hypothetical protein